MCDGHQSCVQFKVAGAVFGEVGGCVVLLCALLMTFHVPRASIMRVIYVAGAIFGDVAV